ncbi:hypothetical protein N9E85_01195 [Gammaproteobacteria bacterium]|nr:hypothetical protein [Gammaproteobacteria bacterium]
MNENLEKETVQRIGQRILSEANDLKRTFESICDELNIDTVRFNKVTSGSASYDEAIELAKLISTNYPVKLGDLILEIPDTDRGLIIMRKEASEISKRIFSRLDRDQNRTPYYEYRDTATATLSPFKPEWIDQLRVVKDDRPDNPDVAYNNGHFLHQMTAFIGPVNFYWEVDGKKHSKQMETGSSNYITPFVKHSFTSRDSSQPAIIIAVTFSSDAGRSRGEFYSLGNDRLQSYVLNNRQPDHAISQLIQQILNDKCLTIHNLKNIAERNNINIDLDELLDPSSSKSEDDIQKLANLLKIKSSVFELPLHESDDVVVKDKDRSEAYIFNSSATKPDYIINPLAVVARLPSINGFDMEIASSKNENSSPLNSSLHTYLYNYGDESFEFYWIFDGKEYQETIYPDDSIYLEPFIEHKFFTSSTSNANIFMFRVPGGINLEVQKEISSYADSARIIESKQWFN